MVESEVIKQPFTNAQLELLKIFSYQLKDSEIIELRHYLTQFFADRLVKRADEIWDEKGWNDAKVDELLHTKLRRRTKLI